MAAEHVSTAVKEEWSLTDEQVALLEASTALSAERGLVNSAARAGSCNVDHIATILVPTKPLGDTAAVIVAGWPVKNPSEADLTGKIEHHLSANVTMQRILDLITALKRKPGFKATAEEMGKTATGFIIDCVGTPHDNGYGIWDAINITDQVLSIGQSTASTYQKKDVGTNEFIYGQLEVALIYNAQQSAFTFGYSYVYKSDDELTTAIVHSGSTDRINAIRILYAILMTEFFRKKGDGQFKTVPSNQPYPTLNK